MKGQECELQRTIEKIKHVLETDQNNEVQSKLQEFINKHSK